MSDYNMGKLGVVAPFNAKEGSITIATSQTAHGDIKAPQVQYPLTKGTFVELDDCESLNHQWRANRYRLQ